MGGHGFELGGNGVVAPELISACHAVHPDVVEALGCVTLLPVVGRLVGMEVVLQGFHGLFQFQLAGYLRQAAAYRAVELFLPHREHLFEVAHLQVEQGGKTKTHDDGNNPNCPLFHVAKIETIILQAKC